MGATKSFKPIRPENNVANTSTSTSPRQDRDLWTFKTEHLHPHRNDMFLASQRGALRQREKLTFQNSVTSFQQWDITEALAKNSINWICVGDKLQAIT